MTVLVAYASEHGSTRGIAERVAARLAEEGIRVEQMPVDQAPPAESYGAVVLGSAIHSGKWLPAAADYVQRNATALAGRPVWLFSVSTVGDHNSAFPARIAQRMRAMRGETPEIAGYRRRFHVRDHRNFTGAIEADHWPATGRLFFKSMRGRYGDHRDWPEIDEWAGGIGRVLIAEPARP